MDNFQGSQIKETFHDELVADSNARFQKFFNFYCTVNLVSSMPVERYIRSSKELIRMANIYFEEKDYLHAFVLYSRFIILFLEKIKTHPGYASFDKSQLNPVLKQVQSIAFPRAEKLKKYIKDVFAAEETKYKEHLELSQKLAGNFKSEAQSNKPMSPEEYEELKQKYNTENENELRLLQQKELEMLANKNKQASGLPQAVGGAVPPPVVDRKLKPRTSNETNNHNLRTMHVPSDLNEKFLEAVQENTRQNVETCGFLAGKLSNNAFVVSTVIIPKQTGTSDTCNTTEEFELFDTIDKLDMITLGWIHTHPSQTAFLSSIDLHTQFGFQIMTPEAIAIVCAPKFNENLTFLLTPDYGMKVISECSQSGFHQHQNNPPIFEVCDHVRLDSEANVKIIDLRRN